MYITLETDNQQPSFLIGEKGSETIPTGSTLEKVEAVNISASNVGDEDIVQKSKAFLKYLERY